MKYILDVPEDKMAFAEEFFKSVSFVTKVKAILPDEITNPTILQSIEEYEKDKIIPTPLSLPELKEMLDA